MISEATPYVRIPQLMAVQSEAVIHVGHDQEANTLFVRFVGGALFRYPRVSRAEYLALRRAPFIGKHLQVQILSRFEGYVVHERKEGEDA